MSLLSLSSYNDLLQKCSRELCGLKKCESHPEYDFILFNIVLGMNHLFEWYLKEKSVERTNKLDCIKRFNPFSSPYDVSSDFKSLYRELDSFPNTNQYQEVIRKLCNKAKHFKQSSIEKQSKNYTAVFGAEYMQCGNPDAACGGFDHYIYSVEIDGSDKDLEKRVSSLLDSWNSVVETDV